MKTFKRSPVIVLLALILSAALSACGVLSVVGADPIATPTPPATQPGSGVFVRGLAPVDELEIRFLESFPVQVSVAVRGNLPDGCTSLDRTAVERQGNTFLVTLFTVRPESDLCTQALLPYEHVVSLDAYGLSAGTYTVDVNGVSAPFVLQMDNFPVEEKASVQGRLWHDLCAVAGGEGGAPAIPTVGCVRSNDGAYRANGIFETSEPALPGVLINLGLGQCPAIGLASIATSADGSFAFSDLAAGTYCVSIDPLLGDNSALLVPGNWTLPAEAADDAVASYTLTLSPGEDRKDLNFGWDFQFLPVPPVLPTPTPTSAPVTPTPKPGLCDAAQFIQDVSIPDGTTLGPKTAFTKTWRLRNVGTCTWTTDYDLVFVSGDQMSAPASVPVTKFIRPGETLEISVRMSAPAKLGRYTGSWQLRNGNGKLFGIGEKADGSFWVRIRVHEPTEVYDLIKVMCKAVWRDGNGQLACPGSETTESGYVLRADNLKLENGQTENEPALVVHPHGVDHGLIVGRFPAFKIQPGDRFQAVIGCVNGAETCDVTFRLRYSIPGVDGGTLETWTETYDGKIRKLDVDLSQLAGHEVEIMLTVRDNGSSEGDLAFWLNPRIMR